MTITMTAPKTDSQTQQDVLRELKWDPRVDETEVGVQVRNGVVTLAGAVTNYGKRIAAAEAAHRVAGVLDVANDLTVRVPGLGRKMDSELADAVRHALQWDVFVPDERIRSTVSNGWVTLEGDVESLTQRQDAERAIHRLSGIAGVTNHVRIVASRAGADDIREAIEGALERQAEREAHRIKVDVRDGVVTLSGKVRSWTERYAVEQAAGYAVGVREVKSRLEVDPCL